MSKRYFLIFVFSSIFPSFGKPKPYPSSQKSHFPYTHPTIQSLQTYTFKFNSAKETDMLTSSSIPFHAPILRHHPSTATLPFCFHNLTPPHPRTPSFLRPPSLQHFPPSISTVAAKSPSADKSVGEQKWVHEGLITESLPNGMFRIRLDNEDLIIGYISGRIRKNFVRILPGDRVRVEVSRYDTSKGRIVYRLRSSTGGPTGTSS